MFAAAAMLLAATGLCGVIGVAQRRREIGIRRALGAGRRDILRLVIGEGFGMTLAGVALGLAGAGALTRWVEALLFGVRASDPSTFLSIVALLMLVALRACSSGCVPCT